jgi:integrase
MAYTECREGSRGTRYRGIYKDADGHYRSAGTYDSPERALEVAQEKEDRAAVLISGAVGGLDPVVRATRTIAEYAPVFLRHHRVEGNTKDLYATMLRLHILPYLGKCRLAETDRTVARNFFTALEEAGRSANTIRQAKVALAAMFTMAVSDGYLDFNPFHDIKTPKVPGRRGIKIATTEQYQKVRTCLPTKPAQVFSTLMVSSGLRFCEAIGLQPTDFDFDACILEVARSVVKVSREHHPQGKTFLVREYTKNGETRVIKLDRATVELVRAHVTEHGISPSGVIFPIELVVPPRASKPRLTKEEIAALGTIETVQGKVYAHGTMAAYTTAKCRCDGCKQWARDYGRDRMRTRREAAGPQRRRWEKSRDADEPYLDEKTWNRIWTAAVKKSGIPFKPTAYQVRHTHASWLIDAGESPKAVMHRLGQSDLRTTARYVHVLDEAGESAAKRFEGRHVSITSPSAPPVINCRQRGKDLTSCLTPASTRIRTRPGTSSAQSVRSCVSRTCWGHCPRG